MQSDPNELCQSNKLYPTFAVYMEVPGGVTVCKDPREYVWWDEVRKHPFEF